MNFRRPGFAGGEVDRNALEGAAAISVDGDNKIVLSEHFFLWSRRWLTEALRRPDIFCTQSHNTSVSPAGNVKASVFGAASVVCIELLAHRGDRLFQK